MKRQLCAISLAIASASLGSVARAQDAAAPAQDATPQTTPPSSPQGETPPVDPPSRVRVAQMPEGFASESPAVPAGSVIVRVVNAQGDAVPNAPVRLGAMRDGERQAPVEQTTGPDGTTRFERLDRSSRIAYRVSTETEGAKFGSMPFQLSQTQGHQVQIVRLEVTQRTEVMLVTEARVEIGFQDDRLVIVQRFSLVNISMLGLDGGAPHPMAFVPRAGLAFTLPQGATAFRSDEQAMGMSDIRVEESHGRVTVRGSFPPSNPREPLQLVWQSRVKLTGTESSFEVGFPELPVLAATVVVQAPPGMILEVTGMPAAQERLGNGQRILITGRQRATRADPAIERLQIRLRNIPSTSGPERNVTFGLSLVIVLGALAKALTRKRQKSSPADLPKDPALRAALLEERLAVLDEVRSLALEHQQGDVGAEHYRRQRHELVSAMAEIDRELAALDEAPPPRV
ncbi:MAG: hypothetical protein Q8Q09_18335 [Deltaproteobacteria bacterium]|nr:hypothetical protein [Deltaproteobacteria bacterium]